MAKKPDFKLGNQLCELKMPTSAQVRKIKTLLWDGLKQAKVVVLDARKTRILDQRLLELAKEAVTKTKLETVVIIGKNHTVLEINKKGCKIKA
jgi:hypothetical protein